MVIKRTVSLCEDAYQFVKNLEEDLPSTNEEFCAQDVAQWIIQLLYISLPYGNLAMKPKGLGRDLSRPYFTRYAFKEGPLRGVYSCSPDKVFVELIELVSDPTDLAKAVA